MLVYSKADEDSLPVKFADQAVCIGPAQSNESYLLIDRIISVAEICDVDAIHPGYGFLAENIHFAEICKSCNITFIGPTPDQMRAMGDKACARETMRKAGVPITPGSGGVIETEEEALVIARKLEYPVIIKASAGGGGRGMRIAHNDASLIQGFHSAKTEAEKAFGNGDVYIEKFIENPKHIEVQILADSFGNVLQLGERDCSMQRRHQKLIEESPSPSISPALRKKLGEAAVKAAKAVKYVSAGTIEFLLGPKEQFYFMEMNTRVQVEHPVTEMVTGVDIIKEQIRIAAGLKLQYTQKQITPRGHAIECRINAEEKDLETSLTSSTVKALNNLLTAYNQEHDADEIMVTSGYRTVEQQNEYYQEYLKSTNDVFKGGVFPGGFSDYNTGAGFDLGIFPKSGESSSYYTPDGEYSWIAENASQYGFILRYPADKTGITNHKTLTYHFRYVGFPHSYYMTQNNLCLEEYIEELKQYTATPLKISAFSKDYEIYYIRANENSDTVAYIPKNVSYTVSGNNIDGFILTLERDQ